MKLDFKRLGGKVNRRIRRNALPSSLMGLVAFSFTLLVFTAVAYTSSLPALVAARANANDSGLFNTVVRAIFGDGEFTAPSDEKDGGSHADGDGEAATGKKDASKASDKTAGSSSSNAAPSRPGFALGGASLQNLLGSVANSAKPEGEDSNSEEKPGIENPDPNKPNNNGATKPNDEPGQSEDPEADPEPEKPQQPTGPTPEEEQAIYEFLLGKAQAVDGYVAEINACVAAFNSDSLADRATRTAHKGTCAALSARLLTDFDQVLNAPSIPNESMYKDEQGELIGMYRCLLSYLGTVREAWDINVSFEDPSARVDEFMVPVHRDTVNGQNKHLTEFYTYYDGFVL